MSDLIDALPMPVIEVDHDNRIRFANAAAEQFLGAGRDRLSRRGLGEVSPPGSPLLQAVEHVRQNQGSITEYAIDINPSRPDRLADIYASPLTDTRGSVLIVIQPRAVMDKIGRQMNHRDAARSLGAMASLLAHEIKNPLSGIRGAAQLIEAALPAAERPLSSLIRTEVDRILRLVERFEVFSDGCPLPLRPVNIHEVLDHVGQLAKSGFARHILFEYRFDPSLPPISGDRDRLIQALLNLVKNAAEAITPQRADGRITLTTAFRPGVSVHLPTSAGRVSLPFEVCVLDNGPGIPEHLAPHLFEPFVTSKAGGSGLGLAMVARVVSDHGGVVECERLQAGTAFRILLPLHHERSR